MSETDHKTRNWADSVAPDLDDMARLAEAVFADLPRAFREACGDVVFRVAEFPDDDVLEELDLESPFDLLGVYTGVDVIVSRGESVRDGAPSRVFLYRRPILDYWSEHEETLGAIVAHVLIHEIGHHLGLSDDDMHAIEESVEP